MTSAPYPGYFTCETTEIGGTAPRPIYSSTNALFDSSRKLQFSKRAAPRPVYPAFPAKEAKYTILPFNSKIPSSRETKGPAAEPAPPPVTYAVEEVFISLPANEKKQAGSSTAKLPISVTAEALPTASPTSKTDLSPSPPPPSGRLGSPPPESVAAHCTASQRVYDWLGYVLHRLSSSSPGLEAAEGSAAVPVLAKQAEAALVDWMALPYPEGGQSPAALNLPVGSQASSTVPKCLVKVSVKLVELMNAVVNALGAPKKQADVEPSPAARFDRDRCYEEWRQAVALLEVARGEIKYLKENAMEEANQQIALLQATNEILRSDKVDLEEALRLRASSSPFHPQEGEVPLVTAGVVSEGISKSRGARQLRVKELESDVTALEEENANLRKIILQLRHNLAQHRSALDVVLKTSEVTENMHQQIEAIFKETSEEGAS